jgi:hypothetical protein
MIFMLIVPHSWSVVQSALLVLWHGSILIQLEGLDDLTDTLRELAATVE